jgi:uncharacterized protein YbgA (DUF1722 family)/uncharacterized protein YbbK (DUF523 family)
METMTPTLRVGVSSCLIGKKVRFDGQHKRDDWLVDVLGPFVEWVPVCPELEVGMGVPRETIRLVGPSASPRLVAERSGIDHTEPMRRFSEAKVAELAALDLTGYVLKKDSPTCGMSRVRVYGEKKGAPRRDGVGAFASVLLEAFPLLPIEEEGRLRDAALRESFVERLFAFARFKAALAEGMSRGHLVEFHTRHKLALLAHSPDGYRKLGKLVANQGPGKGKGSNAAVVAAYGRGLMATLAVPAKRGRHVNVLQHMLGYFRDRLPLDDRRELEEVVRDYQRGLVPLLVPQTLFRHHVRKEAVEYLACQTYLDPDPKELMLRNRA